jgi:hypothetical protein
MIKRLALTLTCSALFATSSVLAHADSITFTFLADKSTVQATAAGLTTSTTTLTMSISDTDNNPPITGLTADLVIVGTGPSSNFSTANFEGSGINYAAGATGVVEVEITSPYCHTAGNVCVEGTENKGTLSASAPYTNGSFGGSFLVTEVDEVDILNYFGYETFDASGSDQVSTGKDAFNKSGTIFTANFAGAQITIDGETPIPTTGSPEPSSLMLLGSGLLGFAGMLRRRRKSL